MSTDSAADEAAQAALYKSTVEHWTLYAIGVTVTLLRTYSRVRAVGFRHLQAEDLLVWVGIVFYTAQTALAYSVGHVAHGLANNGLTDAQRAALSPDNPEYRAAVIGSKIQVAGWTTYSVLMWSLKLSMLAFYLRLTDGLGQRYRNPIYVGFALVIGTFLVSIITIFAACRPFHKYWQINPDPGNACQAAISRPIIWASFATNVSTDIYIILIPIPMLWKSRLKLMKKIAATVVFGAGLFVLVCAILKSVFVLVDPVDGAQLAGEWGTREAFVAVVTTNLPMVFHLFRSWLSRLFGTAFGSSQKTYKFPSGFQTIGGGAGESFSRNRRGPPTVHPVSANLTFSESEERIVDDVKMNNLEAFGAPSSGPDHPPGGIVVCVLLGDNGVGKTTLLTRYATNQLRNPDFQVFDNCAVDVSVDGRPYSLGFWDTWNDDERNRIRRLSYPNTDVFLICFSVVNRQSFSSVEYYWCDELRSCCSGVPWLLVGTQIDARDYNSGLQVRKDRRGHVTRQEGERMARKLGSATYMECSAQNQFNVKELFHEVGGS
ncbi:hypothetical protein CNMCM5878_002018 [Aspergillus fumigatiaffinis]|nr:hypothetical protein CNMCM5878_002018 [Aspergillus fumigatiaffinis]